MRRVAILIALAACGDNRSIGVGLDAGYDDRTHGRYFGNVTGYGPAPDRAATPIPNAQVCIGDECTFTVEDSSFVVAGPGRGVEATLSISATGFLTTNVPVFGAVTGDRNLTGLALISPQLSEQAAMAFGVDPMTTTRGTVLIEATRYDTGKVSVDIDGFDTRYLDDQQNPDPARTQLAATGGAVIYAVPEGEVVIRSTAGRCEIQNDGWPGQHPGEIRLPVIAGTVTEVNPICVGE